MKSDKQLLVLAVLLSTLSVCNSKYHWQTQEVEEVKNYFVFPGTKWCGKGNNAMFYDDLGKHSQTDRCCRGHDHCPTYIPSFKRRYGLLNYHTMQMSHCSCERQLFDCLWKLENPVSTAVGRLYFNVFRTPCFKLVEVKSCLKWSFDWWNLKYYCVKYGTQLKAKKFWLQNYLRQFPEHIRRSSTTLRPQLSTEATTVQREDKSAINRSSTTPSPQQSTEATTVQREEKSAITRSSTAIPSPQQSTEATTVQREEKSAISRSYTTLRPQQSTKATTKEDESTSFTSSSHRKFTKDN